MDKAALVAVSYIYYTLYVVHVFFPNYSMRRVGFILLIKEQFVFRGGLNFEFNRGSVETVVSAKQSAFDG